MREAMFNGIMEITKLLFYFISIACGVFMGFQLCAIHFQNELLKENVVILDLYLELEDYDNAGLSCHKIQNYVDFIAMYGIAFFDIGIDLETLNAKCKGVKYKLLNPNEEYTTDIIEIPQFNYEENPYK